MVYSFSYNKALPKGSEGFVDYVIIGRKKIYFIELKLIDTKDKLRSKQKELLEFIENKNFKEIEYIIINEKNYLDVIERILEEN